MPDTQQINRAIQAGYRDLRRGAFADARRCLDGIDHPRAIHLLALVEKSAGDLQRAADLFERAANMDPGDAEIASNRAVLAKATGQANLAESEFRRALECEPSFVQAFIGLGRLLIDGERWLEATRIYEMLLDVDPENVSGRYGLGTAMLGSNKAELAESIFDQLVIRGSDEPQIRFMRARARLELGRIDEAIADLKISYAINPSDFALRTLAGTYWMLGDQASFAALLDECAGQPELAVTTAEILRQAGEPARAISVLGSARKSIILPPQSWAVAANSYIDLDDPQEAEAAALAGLAENPEDRAVLGCLISSLLMQGRAKEALTFIEQIRMAEPDRQHWIAYEATALRLLGSDRYSELVDIDRFVRAYRLPIPEGFDTLDEFNNAFLHALEVWHQYNAHPLDQSLRIGSQTPRDLTSIDSPVIRAFYNAIDQPIRQYMSEVGTRPDHPLTARNTGNYRIAGAWSVKLFGGGRHINHVHPEGWISSAYYVSVPAETDSDENMAGWIKFGEPPFRTTPPNPPEKWIRPEAGMLVLFPSFLWHGTKPIRSDSVRVTAPFDAVPV